MDSDKQLEVIRLKNLNESYKKTISEQKTKIESLENDNYKLGKAKEKADFQMANMVKRS